MTKSKFFAVNKNITGLYGDGYDGQSIIPSIKLLTRQYWMLKTNLVWTWKIRAVFEYRVCQTFKEDLLRTTLWCYIAASELARNYSKGSSIQLWVYSSQGVAITRQQHKLTWKRKCTTGFVPRQTLCHSVGHLINTIMCTHITVDNINVGSFPQSQSIIHIKDVVKFTRQKSWESNNTNTPSCL